MLKRPLLSPETGGYDEPAGPSGPRTLVDTGWHLVDWCGLVWTGVDWRR